MREYINPMDIPYKYQHYTGFAHREAADPTLVRFKGRYYIFASMSGGFYWSDDMDKWQWHEDRSLDIYSYAPDVRQIGDWLYFCASEREKPSVIRRTRDPMKNEFETVSSPFPFWDPDLFADDDGRVYLYWGCSDTTPIWGVEMDSETFMPTGEKKVVIGGDMREHGFERFNYPGVDEWGDGDPDKKPYIEGAYMTKVNGKYCLQYAGPGTELATYSDGCYVADAPLGPFTYQANNPFSSRPAGFITGAGHGSTIEDEHGNLWHIATCRVSRAARFERRLILSPAGVDGDGELCCEQAYADWPCVVPDGKFDPRDLMPRYMPLGVGKKVTASSQRGGHGPENAVDEDIRTWWTARGCRDEWLEVDLGKVYRVHSVQINFADNEIPILDPARGDKGRYIDLDSELHTRYILEGSPDGVNWRVLEDASEREEDRSHPYLILSEDALLRYVRVTGIEMPYGSDMSVSGLRVFGLDEGAPKPEPVRDVKAVREDDLTVRVTWPAAECTGCTVLYGAKKDKLYHAYQVYGKNEVLITTINRGEETFIRVDRFNEAGIARGETIGV